MESNDDWRDKIPHIYKEMLEEAFPHLPLPSEMPEEKKAIVQPVIMYYRYAPHRKAIELEAMYIRQRVAGMVVGWELYNLTVIKDELTGRL